MEIELFPTAVDWPLPQPIPMPHQLLPCHDPPPPPSSHLLPPPRPPVSQDLLKLARYRMVGAVVAPSPSARYARMPTTVLAARHMRRATSLIQPSREGRPSADDEAGSGPHRLSTGSGGATPAVPLASPSAAPAAGSCEPAAAARHLGTGLPAVAVSQQAGQPAEEVLLFFGIIDFLQAGAGPQLLSCVLLLSCGLVCAILPSWALLTIGPASLTLIFSTAALTCFH